MGPKEYTVHGKRVSRSTYSDASSEDIAGPSNQAPIPLLIPSSSSPSPPSSSSLQSNIGMSMSSREETPLIGKPTSPPTIHTYASPPTPSTEFELVVVNKWAGVGFINGRISPRVPIPMDLVKAIKNKVVDFQGYLDDSNVPITVQGKILEQLFAINLENLCEDSNNYNGMDLRQLFVLASAFFFYLLY